MKMMPRNTRTTMRKLLRSVPLVKRPSTSDSQNDFLRSSLMSVTVMVSSGRMLLAKGRRRLRV